MVNDEFCNYGAAVTEPLCFAPLPEKLRICFPSFWLNIEKERDHWK
jgi:hypothetical protein